MTIEDNIIKDIQDRFADDDVTATYIDWDYMYRLSVQNRIYYRYDSNNSFDCLTFVDKEKFYNFTDNKNKNYIESMLTVQKFKL